MLLHPVSFIVSYTETDSCSRGHNDCSSKGPGVICILVDNGPEFYCGCDVGWELQPGGAECTRKFVLEIIYF